jgi:hemerythrin superfamily protein
VKAKDQDALIAWSPQGEEGERMAPARKSTKSSRSTAAKKAAATRKAKSAKRSTAAKKAAATRKAKSAKRSTAAKKAAATRRAGTTKAARASGAKRSAAKRSTSPKRSVAARKAAATRKAKSAKRSTAAKKAAATRRAGTRASTATMPTVGQMSATPTEARVTGIDAVTQLENDHRTVDDLFSQYEALVVSTPSARRGPVDRFIRELSVHAAIEEEVLYPAVRRELPDGEAMADEALQEHQDAKEILRRLDRMDPSDFEFDSAVTQLIKDVRHHVDEEEAEMFPRLRSALGQERLMQLGARMQEAKRTAPTRP